MGYAVGVDIGGTFTDVVLLERGTGRYQVHKLLTHAADPSESVICGITEVLKAAGASGQELEYVVHGTTLVANTLIQRAGTRTGLLVTAGFEDMIEMRNEQRYDVYDLFSTFPEPLVPAELRIPVAERMLSNGQVLVPIAGDEVTQQLQRLLTQGVESVAICFLHAYAFPQHERVAARLVGQVLPGATVSVSSDIVPHAGEYERLSTTVANAYVQPIMSRYLARLEHGLRDLGCRGHLYLMLSDGGMTPVASARAHPVRLLESGPAAGITATCRLGAQSGDQQLVAFDMGGTTAKICIIDNGSALMTWEIEAARVSRFRKGSGLPLRVPSVEMVEIGAGGGSIAHVNELGLLEVGPVSAGSNPGPSCYGLGGDRPTVTDALLVLGYLNAEYFLGGKLRLDEGRARAAIQRGVARRLGLKVPEAALGIYRVACEQMAEAARVHFAERGKDPRQYVLVAFGGAGPAHAAEVARALRISKVVIPPAAGITSAAGLLMAPLAFSLLRSFPTLLQKADIAEMNRVLTSLTAQAREVLSEATTADQDIHVTWYLDLKYAGQKRTIEVPLTGAPLSAHAIPTIVADFHRLYAIYHGRPNTALEVYVEAVKVRASTGAPGVDWLGRRATPEPVSRPVTHRPAWFIGRAAPIDCPVFRRADLVSGQINCGPALIEEVETTTVVRPEDSFEVDTKGRLILHVNAGCDIGPAGGGTGNGATSRAH